MRIFPSKTTLWKMIFSYIAVLIIPLIFGASLYVTTLNIYKHNVDEANQLVLDNVRDSVNLNLSGVSSMMRALLSDDNITALSNKTQYSGDDYVIMDDLQQTLSMSLLSNSYIEDILIYFNKADFLLSSKSYLNSVESMEGYSATIGLDITQFADQVSLKENYALRLCPTDRSTSAFIASQAISSSGQKGPITILVRLKAGLLTEMIVSEECQTFLVDGNGNTLSREGGTLFQDDQGQWRLEGSGNSQCLVTEDPSFQIQYVRFVPARIYSQDLSTLYLLAGIFLALCLGFGVPLAISIARKSYHPIQEILALIPQPLERHDSDDYVTIRASLTNLLQKNKAYEVERDSSSMAMRTYLLFRLLTSPEMKEAAFLEECRKCQLPFENTSFLVIGFTLDNGSNLFFEQNESANEDMSQFLLVAITTVLRELLTQDYAFFTAEYKGKYYAVLNINPRLDREVAVEEIRKSCLTLAARLDTEFKAIVSVAISNVHTGYPKIRRCYDEVEEITRQQNHLKRSAYVIQFHELDLKKREATPPDLTTVASIAKKDSEKRTTAQEICAYIDEHYSDPNLTVGALSEHFHMTAANLSLHFKRKLSLSPLEYIQLKRVNEAKRLLDTTQMRVTDVAKSVGYYDSRPLIRSFKRVEGVTPAEYRGQKKPLDE